MDVYEFVTNPKFRPNLIVNMVYNKKVRRVPFLDYAILRKNKKWQLMVKVMLQKRPDLVINPETVALCILHGRFDLALVFLHHKSLQGRIDEPCTIYYNNPRTLLFIAIAMVAPMDVMLAILALMPNVSNFVSIIFEHTEQDRFQDMFEALSKCPGFSIDARTLSVILKKFSGEAALFYILKSMQYQRKENEKIIKVQSICDCSRVVNALKLYGYDVVA
jgi:hypothetical protein